MLRQLDEVEAHWVEELQRPRAPAEVARAGVAGLRWLADCLERKAASDGGTSEPDAPALSTPPTGPDWRTDGPGPRARAAAGPPNRHERRRLEALRVRHT